MLISSKRQKESGKAEVGCLFTEADSVLLPDVNVAIILDVDKAKAIWGTARGFLEQVLEKLTYL